MIHENMALISIIEFYSKKIVPKTQGYQPKHLRFEQHRTRLYPSTDHFARTRKY